MIEQNSRIQKKYSLTISILYDKHDFEIDLTQINFFNINKMSEVLNYNLYDLNLINIHSDLRYLLENNDLSLTLSIYEDGKNIMSNTFEVFNLNELSFKNGLFNIQLILIDKNIRFLKDSILFASYKLNTDSNISQYRQSFDVFSETIEEMVSNVPFKLKTHIQKSGLNPYLYTGIRLPLHLTDLSLFDYYIEHYNPYVTKPYIILDDMYRDDDSIDMSISADQTSDDDQTVEGYDYDPSNDPAIYNNIKQSNVKLQYDTNNSNVGNYTVEEYQHNKKELEKLEGTISDKLYTQAKNSLESLKPDELKDGNNIVDDNLLVADDSYVPTTRKKSSNITNYHLIVSNLHDFKSMHQVNIYMDKSFDLNSVEFINTSLLIDKQEIYELTNSILILDNPESNKQYQTNPKKVKADMAKHINITTDVTSYLKTLYAKKFLSDHNARKVKLRLTNLNFESIQLGKVYNILDKKKYQDLPINIIYSFQNTFNDNNLFDITTDIELINSPETILIKGN
jgi:hypothetical protein